jgi:hypothetical protein
MNRIIPVTLALLLGSVSLSTHAAAPDDACAALMDARGHLMSMLGSTDKATQDDLKAKIHAASAKLDGILAGMSGADAAKAGEFKPVWEEFKKTRETEIIPAIQAGKAADVKAIASGIQAERMKKLKGTMGCK